MSVNQLTLDKYVSGVYSTFGLHIHLFRKHVVYTYCGSGTIIGAVKIKI